MTLLNSPLSQLVLGRGILDYPSSVCLSVRLSGFNNFKSFYYFAHFPLIFQMESPLFATLVIVPPSHVIPTSSVPAVSDRGHLALRARSFFIFKVVLDGYPTRFR